MTRKTAFPVCTKTIWFIYSPIDLFIDVLYIVKTSYNMDHSCPSSSLPAASSEGGASSSESAWRAAVRNSFIKSRNLLDTWKKKSRLLTQYNQEYFPSLELTPDKPHLAWSLVTKQSRDRLECVLIGPFLLTGSQKDSVRFPETQVSQCAGRINSASSLQGGEVGEEPGWHTSQTVDENKVLPGP